MTGRWLELKHHPQVPGPLLERIADLTRQCLPTFCRSMVSLTSKLNFRRIQLPGDPNKGWVLDGYKEPSPVGAVR